jgi:ferritin-like metal-binding protein YciE
MRSVGNGREKMQLNSCDSFGSFDEKLIYELNVIYDAEIRFLEAQQHMVRQTRSESLIQLLVQNINEARQQIRNLQLAFKLIDREPTAIVSEIMVCLIADAQLLMQQNAINPEALKRVIVQEQMRIKDFEIVCYRYLMQRSKQLEVKVISCLIAENLQQEKQAVERLRQYL